MMMNPLSESQEAKLDLKALIRITTVALAQLDAARLEEISESCLAWTMSSTAMQEVHDARNEMAVLARILETTRSNIEVLARLRAIKQGQVGQADSEQLTRVPGYGVGSFYGNY
jgi:hypothetical protein